MNIFEGTISENVVWNKDHECTVLNVKVDEFFYKQFRVNGKLAEACCKYLNIGSKVRVKENGGIAETVDFIF